ncbi:TonB-dependent siderophore receptor [Dyella sp. A6]|uniref:TonB-dependent siderophore receptor n=1 Tax=Dyella aluminiiresistens TaxID=3069105 RepID=UPI002E780C6B|nr:TonB-dependent siderophore receptor [Dyella sp. A6]
MPTIRLPAPALLPLALLAAIGSSRAAETSTAPSSAQNTTQSAQSQAKSLPTVQVNGQAAPRVPSGSVAVYGPASLHDTPAAISVVSHQQLADAQVQNLRDLVRQNASLSDDYAPVGYYQDIAIRGFPIDLATGIRFNDLIVNGEQDMSPEDKQSVQILKGLAGIEAGVMEPGGLINYVTKRPAKVREVTFGTDSHGSRYAAIDYGTWLTPNFGVRVNAAYDVTHSYVEQANGRRNFYSIAADWRITPNAKLELDSDYEARAQRSVSGFQLLGGTTLPTHVDVTRMLGYEPWQQPVSIHSSNTSVRYIQKLSDNWQLRLAAGHSRALIDDNVAFAYGCYYVSVCADGTAIPGHYFAPDGQYDVYDWRSPDDTRTNDQVRAVLQGRFETGTVSHQLTFGVSDFRRQLNQRAYVYDYVGTASIYQPNPPYFPPSPNQPGTPVPTMDSWQHTGFAMDRMTLTPHWQVLAGAQFVRLHERTWDFDGTKLRDTRMEKLLPQAAVLWKPTAALTGYVSYAKGLSLGVASPFWTSNGNAILGPRLSRQWETGLKWKASDALDLNAALFHISLPYQYAKPDSTAAGYTFVQQGSEVHTGLELNADGALTDNLTVHASVSTIRAVAENSGTPAYDGHQVENVPRWRASTMLAWRLPVLPQLTLLGGWRYASSNPATPSGSVRAPAWQVFDAGLRYQTTLAHHAVTWRLMVNNVFDHFYWVDTGTSGGDAYLFPGAPRLARLTMSYAL